MLFIGDIHIHPRYGTLTLDTLREYIEQFPHEKNIIFLGDYVYHFSYHRPSLLALLDLFIELAAQEKHVYVLTWNHDRLGQHFVFSETVKILGTQQHPFLHIITEPTLHTIENRKVLFLPYLLSRSWYEAKKTQYPDWDPKLQILIDSKNTNEIDSYVLNAYLEDQIAEQMITNDNLWIVHHYYTANTNLPGIKSQFYYKDKAISPHFLDKKNITFISWHIHHSFSYKNYLCLWAVRSTSPLESNILQRLTRYDSKNNIRELTQTAINPYLALWNITEQLTLEHIAQHRTELQEKTQDIFVSESFSLQLKYCQLPLARSTITIYSDEIAYETMDEHIAPEMRQQLREIQLKQKPIAIDQATRDLVEEGSDFSSSWSNRRQLLHYYLERKYGEKKSDYIKLLDESDIKF